MHIPCLLLTQSFQILISRSSTSKSALQSPKPRTRHSQPLAQKPAISGTTVSETEAITHIRATKRARDILEKNLPTSAQDTTTKDTDWDLFVHAMANLESVPRNAGGLAVAFEHTSKRKIMFHRPHFVVKIDGIMLQSMGKRSSKHFRWGRDVFLEGIGCDVAASNFLISGIGGAVLG